MNFLLKPTVGLFLFAALLVVLSFTDNSSKKQEVMTVKAPPVKIQAAILLDVSNSMDGLIDQAKAQLWNMVTVMGKAKCSNGVMPQIEIALYEYGRSSNDVKLGYVKKINGFIADLDSLSENLFSLTTEGGDEYCGQVIHTSMDELNWDGNPDSYKVIFIAGNEDFLQGDLPYTKACKEAKKKGVIVNTIYCGDRLSGIKEHWNLGAECGNGSFSNINQDAKLQEVPTPYDSLLFTLNDSLNNTYIAYGYSGVSKQMMQASVDKKNYSANKTAAIKRVTVKGKKELYKNESWDLVDAEAVADSVVFLKNLDRKTLPDSLRTKSTNELKQVIQEKREQRNSIQEQIATLSMQRDKYITEEKKRKAVLNNAATLESEVEKIIKEQALRYKMKID